MLWDQPEDQIDMETSGAENGPAFKRDIDTVHYGS